MIHELRTYTLKAGTQAAYLKLSGEVGRKIRGDRYGKLEGSWYTELGKSVPFMVVFFDAPEDIDSYRLEARDSE